MIDLHEVIGLVAAVFTTTSFLPQVFKTYKTKDTSGLSLSMYIIFFIGVLLWLIYGVWINSLSIILANLITAILTLYLLVMKIKYK
ncbi:MULTISPECIES: SemiSWEET family sugar transporter [Polaribacter]|uniref:SemiSWEET family sugar transporter n=1 Tax=Polaribacter TaxID=52959 RepID=UPI001B80C66C|nr:SemiSWEET transporter [Polaribacter butkevichii]